MSNPMDVCEGVAGALSCLREMMQTKHQLIVAAAFANLKRRGLTGSLLYIAYSDVCGKDIDKLLDRLEEENDDFEKEVIRRSRGE